MALIRTQHSIPTACPVDTEVRAVRGDGLLPVALAAERLRVSTSLGHVWTGLGAIAGEQRVAPSKRWVRLDDRHDWSRFPRAR